MSKYISEFKAINGKIYEILVETSKGNESYSLSLGGEPFITEMDKDEGQIYSPIKGSRATIQYLMQDYIFDLYSESPTGTSVKLKNLTDNIIEWSGYITPQMFSQSFELGPNELELEAVDCISVLEDLKFRSEDKQIVSFEALFRKIFSQVNVRYLFVSDNVTVDNMSSETILNKLFISELNFFDKKDSDETDDDVCWNCLDVISEMCQFLGYSALMVGEDVYLLDYDAIKAGNTTYYRYDIKNNILNPTKVTVSNQHKIIGIDHYSNNATVSLDQIYHKITIKADTYSFDNLTSDNEINITDTKTESFSSSLWGWDYIFAEVFPADNDQTKAMNVWIDAHNDAGQYGGGKHNYTDFVVMKFLSKENTKFWIYDKNWNDVTSTYDKAISHDQFRKLNGGIFVKYFTKNLCKSETDDKSYVQKKWNEYYKELQQNPNLSSSKYLDYCLDYAGITNISWSDAIIMNNFNAKSHPAASEWYKYPYYQIECEGSVILGGDNAALIIQGNFYWHHIANSEHIDSYPMEYKDYKLDKENWINPNEDMFIPASIQWGNLWWNGEDWQNTKCGFKLNWLSKEDRDDNAIRNPRNKTIDAWKCQKTVMQAKELTNTVNWRFGTNEKGCLIKLPTDTNLTGKPILTIYRPVTGRLWKSRKDYYNGDPTREIRWPWYFVALTNFKFRSIVGDPSYSDANKTDTIYTNELENDAITEMSEISFKIHTYDNKENTYSAVAYSNGEKFIDKIRNRSLNEEEKNWYDYNGNLATNGLRSEEHLIFKLCKQYTTPSKILECEIKKDIIQPFGLYQDTTLSGDYIVDSIGTNYRYSYNTVKLLEKK